MAKPRVSKSRLKLVPAPKVTRDSRHVAYRFARRVRDGEFCAVVTLGLYADGGIMFDWSAPNSMRTLQLIGGLDIVQQRARDIFMGK